MQKHFRHFLTLICQQPLVLLSGNEKRKEIKKSFASPAVRKACVKTAGCNVTYLNLSRVSHKENAARTFCLLGRSNNAALSAPINTSFWVTQRPEVIDFPTWPQYKHRLCWRNFQNINTVLEPENMIDGTNGVVHTGLSSRWDSRYRSAAAPAWLKSRAAQLVDVSTYAHTLRTRPPPNAVKHIKHAAVSCWAKALREGITRRIDLILWIIIPALCNIVNTAGANERHAGFH